MMEQVRVQGGGMSGLKAVISALIALAVIATKPVLSQLLPVERSALVELYNATSGATWLRRSAWVADSNPANDPCLQSWEGVACSGTTPQHVMYALRVIVWEATSHCS